MDSEYDRKFEEMKKYIPFLESMIKRLESTSSSSSNPRQAQLDKIKSLRDLLLDKKKRMKMENLRKCEQVLVNLYAKVEQRDTLPGIKKASEPLFPSIDSIKTENPDLDTVRNKLKCLADKTNSSDEIDPDTLPEIARASETEVVCTPGSKEPALFQRRPNKASPPQSRSHSPNVDKKSPHKSVPKRSYTRVLVSPEPANNLWSPKGDNFSEKPLFSRRSPRKSPKRHSPTHKKEKKKSSRQNKSKLKDLNITLNVPEDSLSSLNTGDILSRIINCPDNDVEIDTLRDLRAQILSELKQTGSNDDISDLILQSYKTKKKKKEKQEIEEGELSDSESEAIESIYGSLVVVDKEKASSCSTKTAADKEKQPRKIQICLVINSDKGSSSADNSNNAATATSISDFEMFDEMNKPNTVASHDQSKETKNHKGVSSQNSESETVETQGKNKMNNSTAEKISENVSVTIEDEDTKKQIKEKKKKVKYETKDSDSSFIDISSSDTDSMSSKKTENEIKKAVSPFKPNFYTPLNEQEKTVKSGENTTVTSQTTKKSINENCNNSQKSINATEEENKSLNTEENIEIPLLNLESTKSVPAQKDVVSEIDILQALKNDILSESLSILGADVITPPLHQPKVTKVASAQQIVTKKRISIDKYKAKSVSVTKSPLFFNESSNSKANDVSKKQSLKLTEQECERFNFITKLALEDSSDDEEKDEANYSTANIYKDLAPKSPENDDEMTAGEAPPIIIPEDPIKPTIASSKADVDMRTLKPLLSPPKPVAAPEVYTFQNNKLDIKTPLLLDPRMRREINTPSGQESPHGLNPERTPRLAGNFLNTPNTRPYERTPSHSSFDYEDNSNLKHVYAPLPSFDARDSKEYSINRDGTGSRWEPNSEPASEDTNYRWDSWKDSDVREGGHTRKWDDRDRRGSSNVDYQKSKYGSDKYQRDARNDRHVRDQRDEYYSRDCPRTPVHSFGRSDCPTTPIPSFGKLDTHVSSYGRSDCPLTPVHPFGRLEHPMTPTHPFGRSEAPLTPNHPFGRSDAPKTPNHPFGRSEAPLTPNHHFGRSEAPMTPNHHFGRSEAPMTPNHPFGRADASMTPSHPFGRSEAPMTPNHPYGRSDAPMTPSHPFGRSEVPKSHNHPFGRPEMGIAPLTPSHPFGRSDYSQNQQYSGSQIVKDPRLNRSTEYDSHSRIHEDDRSRSYRRNSDVSSRPYIPSESYRHSREQSVGRNKIEDTYHRTNREQTPGRERSVGRGLSKDNETDRLFTRERSFAKNDHRQDNINHKMAKRQEQQRARSVNRSVPTEDTFRRSSRAPSAERNQQASADNTLSVKSKSGRSFTIDTSVNTTFQEFLSEKGLQVFDYSLDARRQRAASVGRSLTREPSVAKKYRESSVGRTLPRPEPNVQEEALDYKNIVNFVRARSMGRELSDKSTRSFKDVKAEFESYRYKQNVKLDSKGHLFSRGNTKKRYEMQQDKKRNSFLSSKKVAYSPRKNSRDPRISRERYDGRHKKQFGIVYSDDNIAKGTILGSGYGVKNYKIPKIKRPIEEVIKDEKSPVLVAQVQKENIVSDKSSSENEVKKIAIKKVKETSLKTHAKKGKETTEGLVTKNVNKYDDSDSQFNSDDSTVCKRNTRSSRNSRVIEIKSQPEPVEPVVRTRRGKKAIIDSDSDTDIAPDKIKVDNSKANTEMSTFKNVEKYSAKKEDSFFGMDLDTFPDNIADAGSDDPVMANINALIADLDNDIDVTKDENSNSDFARNISFDNMIESIHSCEVDKQQTSQLNVDTYSNGISDRIKENITNKTESESLEDLSSNEKNTVELSLDKKSHDTTKIEEAQSTEISFLELDSKNTDISKEFTSSSELLAVMGNLVDNQDSIIKTSKDEVNQEIDEIPVLVSTTESAVDTAKIEEIKEDRCSTPDSTININETFSKATQNEGLPDSTNEKSEMHSDVTSTHNQSEGNERIDQKTENSKPSSSSKEAIDSIGNLLSMLQDKDKIKELLSMISNNSSNSEKIKKKLEKLSEIVSDEDESNGAVINEITEKEHEKDNSLNDTDINILGDKDQVDDPNCSLKPCEDVLNNLDVKESGLQTDEQNEANENNDDNQEIAKKSKPRKTSLRRTKKGKWKAEKKASTVEEKRVTRAAASGTINIDTKKPKKPSRELKQLQESIKEMFLNDDILNATGIRMCRLAKLVDDKISNQEEVETNTQTAEPNPVVMLEKFKDNETLLDAPKTKKKSGPKSKSKTSGSESGDPDKKPKDKIITTPKYKPGPKSRTKINQEEDDPYSFDDSVSETTMGQTSEQYSSDSENDSLTSSESVGSSELLTEFKKKPKRKRRLGWQSGVIKPKNKKRKKTDTKQLDTSFDESIVSQKQIVIPDHNCFVDKTYCFLKNVSTYSCRLCKFSGSEIVKHYKTDHPHTEIPLSRMNMSVAREAIEQCEDINFQAISKMSTDKYVCRFCFKEFSSTRMILEQFFWHVVSMHTGEYKQLCSECINVTRCPFNLDIPPPPKDLKGQLIGYICGKCNFTQISLENLKTHVIVRHNDEQTAVFTINLAAMSKRTINALMKRCNETEQPRVLRSSRSNPSLTGASDRSEISDNTDSANRLNNKEAAKTNSNKKIDEFPKAAVHTKLMFENDDNDFSESGNMDENTVKLENELQDSEKEDEPSPVAVKSFTYNESEKPSDSTAAQSTSSDIYDYPHFKIRYTKSGLKEYVCCINGIDNHYTTSLLISMKRHTHNKHSEIWDGYCSVCKVIVMPQGEHRFKECLQHFLDNHMDNFPVLEELDANTAVQDAESPPLMNELVSSKPFINVRPLADLLSTDSSEVLPKIHSVMSLGLTKNESPQSATEVTLKQTELEVKDPTPEPRPALNIQTYKYEEVQTEVMAKKHRVILDTMLAQDKLVQIFKCAGRFCSFTTDSADAAVLHASTHQRIGGENALMCAYCDFDCKENAIDLVMHVFKTHGRCQYVCGICFYRAVASQLVLAHIRRVHADVAQTVGILQTETVTPGSEESQDLLPRTEAVKHYVCVDVDNVCKFKTYTPGKFIEHIVKSKHATFYSCYICSETTQNPNDLVHHMKSHKLRLYQCTWCVDGGDNEVEFLDHSSFCHPSKQPQAYLRIITNNNKDGASKTMVLPLAKLNKSNVPTVLIKPAGNAGDPAREAKRALELEKIITSMPLLANETTYTAIPSAATQKTITQKSQELTESSCDAGISITDPCCLETSSSAAVQETVSIEPLLNVKKEPAENNEKNELKTDVICLDSDEDDVKVEESKQSEDINESEGNKQSEDINQPESNKQSEYIKQFEDNKQPEVNKQTIIDLSDDDLTTTPENKDLKIDQAQLLKCPKCHVIFKTLAGFKRHVQACCIHLKEFKCAHCSFVMTSLNDLHLHYFKVHGNGGKLASKSPLYVCGMCNRKDKNITSLKTHIRKEHGLSTFVVMTKVEEDHQLKFIMTGTEKSKLSKRKLSGGATLENQPKRTRYGPKDVDKLPQKPILDELTYCSECEFSSKVRLNLVRHFQQHAEAQTVPQTAPVNPVPHLETNEKYFDRMINLASSSLETARSDKSTLSIVSHIPPEAAARFPKYVPDRQRHTCGAKGCSYISVDEAMLKCHWETLHTGSNDFHCVHCPPYQHLDTSKPLSAARIIAHLKMHDIRLYACSLCSYYHYRRQVLDKHLSEIHKGLGEVLTVREELTNQVSSTQPAVNTAPTMDLKPWKCGLCAFKSMLRPEVIEHCSKTHNTKMQFKCPVCPYRTSTFENVTKHQAHSHPDNTEDVFYYYYREGSIPDDPDGTPRWMRQYQKLGNPEPEVKTEIAETPQENAVPAAIITPAVNLDIVKQEAIDPEVEDSQEDLCRRFGEFGEPSGLKYKCPLCKLVLEDNKDAMQSHLFEELQYRKWGCNICSYKAFHKTGLSEHMVIEHRLNGAIKPIELPVDLNIERWVTQLLEHQTEIIETNKLNLVKQKIQIEKSASTPTTFKVHTPIKTAEDIREDLDSLKQAFGPLGTPSNMNFCCPKCDFQVADERAMKDHLEMELNKIRWRCSSCWGHSQNYHEAQLHTKTCKMSTPGVPLRPVEAIRDPNIRAAWLAAVINNQRTVINKTTDSNNDIMSSGPPEDSLLVVRYEKNVPTPEEQMLSKRKRPPPATTSSPDSDEERLVIDEPSNEEDTQKKKDGKKCLYCDFTTRYQQTVDIHMLRHFKLKPLTCCYCEFTFNKCSVSSHTLYCHPNMPERFRKTTLPSGPPLIVELSKRGKRSVSHDETTPKKEILKKEDDGPKIICLVCEKTVLESEIKGHTHEKAAGFAKKGDVVVKCCVCLSLFANVRLMHEHHDQYHSDIQINYAFFKLHHDTREFLQCGHCSKRFKFLRDIKTHHNTLHASLQLKYESKPFVHGAYLSDFEAGERGDSSQSITDSIVPPAVKRVAKKSTTKLPSQSVAKKSTTKLPYTTEPDRTCEYSFYGTKPTPIQEFENVTTLMPFCNTLMQFTVKKLGEIINLNPKVFVKDCEK